jgi:hypothetical protein
VNEVEVTLEVMDDGIGMMDEVGEREFDGMERLGNVLR